MLQTIKNVAISFAKEEEGIALTEYLILLALLTAGVIAAVLLIGDQLQAAWTGWANWFVSQQDKLDGPS